MSTCRTCPFYHPLQQDEIRNITAGQCRFDPPKLVPAMGQMTNAVGIKMQPDTVMQIGYTNAYPGTNSEEWCGKHPQRTDLLKYDRNEGFSRTPTLAEARQFMPPEEHSEG